jgi:hypothetical protein
MHRLTIQFVQPHFIIGFTIFGLVLLQPLFGIVHHKIIKKNGDTTVWTLVHRYLGRFLITLAFINGGLGIGLAENTTKGKFVYGVIVGVIWIVYMTTVVYQENKISKEKLIEKKLSTSSSQNELEA